jgi:hypothetical protein
MPPRFAFPDEIQGICVYLASDGSSFMTGSVLMIVGVAANIEVVRGNPHDERCETGCKRMEKTGINVCLQMNRQE